MPVLRQLFTDFRKRRNPQDSHSSQRPFRAGDNPNNSPLLPSSIENIGSDYIPPSLSSPRSTLRSKGRTKSEIDSENKSSPTFSITSRFGRMSLTVEREVGVEECRDTKGNRGAGQEQAKHDSVATLGNPAMLGYSCEIEGGSPKLRS